MFRKPKRPAKKQSLRKKEEDDGDTKATAIPGDGDINKTDRDAEEEEETTAQLLNQARKRLKQSSSGGTAAAGRQGGSDQPQALLHSFAVGGDSSAAAAAALVTSTVAQHPDRVVDKNNKDNPHGDGVFRAKRNKFWAGPIKAATNVRVTTRFDYQPDICKDYKETGFCGFGDSCIYLHDRGDTLSGWQLEEKWQEEQRLKKEQQEKEMNDFLEKSEGGGKSTSDMAGVGEDGGPVTDDGLPFACHLCRNAFEDPVVTACQHYFCERCILSHVRNQSDACPVCQKETHRVFNEPTKLLAKKRQVLGLRESKQEGSWKAFYNKMSNQQ